MGEIGAGRVTGTAGQREPSQPMLLAMEQVPRGRTFPLIQRSVVSLTQTEGSISHTSSAVAPRGKLAPGSPGRRGSGSEPRRAEGQR